LIYYTLVRECIARDLLVEAASRWFTHRSRVRSIPELRAQP